MEMNSPEVSFIIPLYNESEVFSELIEHMDKLLLSIEEPCEVILVDDGSKDNTPYYNQRTCKSGLKIPRLISFTKFWATKRN